HATALIERLAMPRHPAAPVDLAHRETSTPSSRLGIPPPPPRQPAQEAAAHQIAGYRSVDRQSRRADAARQPCYSRSWRIALLERFWQARHPPRYAAYLTPSSPSFPHNSRITPSVEKWRRRTPPR